ncbi:hypothetical protein [Polaribacter ponticola]|uniref:Uncharacterized protein n=1 Tax=Polaribacter ponticola TaxID=2978475 RepID=A0ABT5S6R4_9FLAO|nr:hypothetical protein [Polaribacter sp. MSW5]MDD7913777.1 hypothetical protein [Polaribacter sp. MSW5]
MNYEKEPWDIYGMTSSCKISYSNLSSYTYSETKQLNWFNCFTDHNYTISEKRKHRETDLIKFLLELFLNPSKLISKYEEQLLIYKVKNNEFFTFQNIIKNHKKINLENLKVYILEKKQNELIRYASGDKDSTFEKKHQYITLFGITIL